MAKNVRTIFGEEVDVTGIKNPYQLYRRMRPYYFSDSKTVLKMSKDQFEFIMSQLAANMKQDLFEDFTRQLVVRLITPNIIPSTGPAGHGDGGTDLETHAVSDEVAKLWTVEDGGCKGDEKWAFAVSTTSQWEQKIVRDVRKIMGLNRGFTRIYFCTNQKVSSLKKSKYFNQFKTDYNIEVTILDYGWYQQAVFENGCYNIAIQTLNLDSSLLAVVEEGPNDKLHKQEIKELEDKIADMQKVQHLNTDYVEDLLLLAILERTISDDSNHSKLAVKSRFNTALSEAEKHGLSQQIFNIHYQMAWTEFYWNEDPDAMLEQYDILKEMILEEINPARVEKATNLSNLLRTAVTCNLFSRDVDTTDDDKYWDDLYQQLEKDPLHTSTFLYLRIVRLESSIMHNIGEDKNTDDLLVQLKEALKEADHHLDISFESHMTILSAIGEHIAFSSVYEDVIDQLAEIQAKRESDTVAADTHYTRGMQNIYRGNYESAIKHLGQCISAYQKEPTRTNLIQACGMLANAYANLDLLMCAKVFYIKALSLLVHQMEVEGSANHLLISITYELCIIDIKLGQINDCLFWLNQMDYLVSALPHFNDEKYTENRMMLDAMLASAIINTPSDKNGLQYLPDIFSFKGLTVSSDALLYRLGYEDEVSQEFRDIIMTSDDWEKQLQEKSSEIPLLQPVSIAEKNLTSIRTTIKGCTITVSFKSTSYLYSYAQLCLATIEAFMATMQINDIAFAYPAISIQLKEQYRGKTEVNKGSRSNEYIVKINRAESTQQKEWELVLQLLSNILARNSMTSDIVELNNKKEQEEKLWLRLTVMSSHTQDFKNVCLNSYPAGVESWIRNEDKLYPNKRENASQKNSNYQGKQTESIITDLIDYPLWDKAKWSGCGYIIDRMFEHLPIMIFMYRDITYGKKIFEKWESDFKEKKLNIKITIITGVDKAHPTWYKVLVSPDMRKSLTEEDIKNHRYVVAASRFHLMQARDDLNIRYLREAYNMRQVVGITAIEMDSNNAMTQDPQRRYPKVIPVRDLEFREAWTIGVNDEASMAILPTDTPIIPEDRKEYAPVIELIQKKKRQ